MSPYQDLSIIIVIPTVYKLNDEGCPSTTTSINSEYDNKDNSKIDRSLHSKVQIIQNGVNEWGESFD